METKGKLYTILVVENLDVRDHTENLGVDGRLILKRI
jgi:hypothetical protein